MANKTAPNFSKPTGCVSLAGSGLTLSSTNVTIGTVVRLECSKFGHRPTNDVQAIVCHITGDWMPSVPSCEWSWNFSTHEKVIFGTLVAAASFLIVVSIAVFIAYIRCHKKRRAVDKKVIALNHKHQARLRAGEMSLNLQTVSNTVTHLAYQDSTSNKKDGNTNKGTLDNPWLGYIPRPKVTEGHAHKGRWEPSECYS